LLIFLGWLCLKSYLHIVKEVLELNAADLLVVSLPFAIPILSFVKLIGVRNSHKESDGQERHNDESNYHNYEKYVSHARIFPLYEIFVLFKVVTVPINKVKSRCCTFLEVPELRPVPSLLLYVIFLFHLFELFWVYQVFSDLFEQTFVLNFVLLFDLINFSHQWVSLLLTEKVFFNDWRYFIGVVI
jgi:hypothetical protein